MALKDLQALFPLSTASRGKNHHPRKRGPGRYNRLRAYSRGIASEMHKAGYSSGIEADAHWDSSGFAKRLAPAKQGGNWQGKGFLSYSEIDAHTREALSSSPQYDTVYTHKGYRRMLASNLTSKREGR